MYIGVDIKGNRVDIAEAKEKEQYFCPICKAKLIQKRGNIKIHHFAHESGSECDSWNYDMSEWHREWQKRFPVDSREVVVEKKGIKHRADILINKTVVEFQHSKISNEEFNDRNLFYKYCGYDVIWLFDLREYYDDERITVSYNNGNLFIWKWPPHTFDNFWPKRDQSQIKVFFQFSDLDKETYGIEQLVWRSPDTKRFITEEGVAYNDTEFLELILKSKYQSLKIQDDTVEETWATGNERTLISIIENSSSNIIIVKNSKTGYKFKIGISKLRGKPIRGSIWGYMFSGNSFESEKREVFSADKKEWTLEWER